MDTKQLFDEEVKKCGDGAMTPEERRAAYSYFLRGMAVNRHEIGSLREMEHTYSHQLGEMARLSDKVCGWVRSPLADPPSDVWEVADEIMQYVEAVRPPEGSKDPEWMVHIIGPDDLHPCTGEFDALRRANQHNKAFAKLMETDPSPNDPYCVALAKTREEL